jgi:peptidyl-prolyl cis-trans isomerase-like 4
VIRDVKSGESLQYAFIEFEERKSCEDAYFKMDNVLIDDRRIHVDFSQSVAKYKWKGKGRGVEVRAKEEDPARPSAPWIRKTGGPADGGSRKRPQSPPRQSRREQPNTSKDSSA